MYCPICNRPMGFKCIVRNVWQRVVFILKNPRISWWIISKIYPTQQNAAQVVAPLRPKYSLFQSFSNKIFNHCIHYDETIAYRRWQKSYESSALINSSATNFTPSFLFIIHQSKLRQEAVVQFITSVEKQSWKQKSLRIAVSGKSFHEQVTQFIKQTEAQYICLVEEEFILSENSLAWVAQYIDHEKQIIYGDHDHLDETQSRLKPCFKPNWDDVLQRNTNYTAPLVFFSLQIFDSSKIAESANNQILLRDKLAQSTVLHVPRILSHVPHTFKPETPIAYPNFECEPIPQTTFVHQFPKQTENQDCLVSIIIPTKDGIELLQKCITSIYKHNETLNFEIIVIENNSQDASTFEYLKNLAEKHSAVRILHYQHPFNYSDINNWAVTHANGSVLCFMNNDIELTTKGGLEQMLRYVQAPEIGAVGAKLLYPDHTIQHVGVCLGLGGIAGHLLRSLPFAATNHLLYTHAPRQVNAVTGALLMVRKEVFEQVGGFDAQNLAVAYNDVDLCLKIRSLELKNIFLSTVEAYHYESASRPSDFSAKQSKRYIQEGSFFKDKWQSSINNDEFYNENFGKEREDLRIWQ